MNTKNNKIFGNGVTLVPSFADECREMEDTLQKKLLTMNIKQTSSTYLNRMVGAMQALHELNKHH